MDPVQISDDPRQMQRIIRNLLALSALPAAWAGCEGREIAEGCLDVLRGLLHVDLGFIQICDPETMGKCEAVCGPGGYLFADWVCEQQLNDSPTLHHSVSTYAAGGNSLCVVMLPIGMNAISGTVALASAKEEFPDKTDLLLASVAANHASTAFRTTMLMKERARATESLRRQEEMNRKILESGHDGIKVLLRDGTVDYLNPPAARALELDNPCQVLGRRWVELWEGEDRVKAERAVRGALEGREGRFQGTRLTFKGNQRWWDVVVMPMSGADGAVEKLLTVSRDVTVIREAGAATASEQRQIPAGI